MTICGTLINNWTLLKGIIFGILQHTLQLYTAPWLEIIVVDKKMMPQL
jgi:hypothetical protein